MIMSGKVRTGQTVGSYSSSGWTTSAGQVERKHTLRNESLFNHRTSLAHSSAAAPPPPSVPNRQPEAIVRSYHYWEDKHHPSPISPTPADLTRSLTSRLPIPTSTQTPGDHNYFSPRIVMPSKSRSPSAGKKDGGGKSEGLNAGG